MKIRYSEHWARKRGLRRELSDDVLTFAIENSQPLSDRDHEGLLNAICRIPPVGRKIKVVYRRTGKGEVHLITAYWME